MIQRINNQNRGDFDENLKKSKLNKWVRKSIFNCYLFHYQFQIELIVLLRYFTFYFGHVLE